MNQVIASTFGWVQWHKPLLGAFSVAIGVVAYGIYIWQTAKNEGIRPHPLSWLLWAFVSTVATLAQQTKGAGPGTWVTAFTAVVCLIIGLLTLSKYEWRFSRSERISFATGVVAVGFFVFAKNPTAAAIFATIADVLGYDSTIKKGWVAPQTDSATSFLLNSVKFIPALLALDAYSVATWLYPATLVIVNSGVAIMLLARRRNIAQGVG
jgi:hypothetical protein